MAKAGHERRKHRHFRVLFMDFRAFLRRLLGPEPQSPSGAPLPAAPVQTPEPSEPREDPFCLAPMRPLDGAAQPPFASGNGRIDQQHAALLAAIQALGAALRTQDGEACLPRTMASLATYVEDHFSFEEAYMRSIGFPGLGDHLKEHAYFRAQVHQLEQRVAVGDTTVILELSSVLFKWFKNHLLQEDRLYVAHARQLKGGGGSRQ